MSYEIRALAEGDGCHSLRLGDAALVPLKTFLRKEAKRLHADDLAKTFVLVKAGESRPLAYATLVCTHVSAEQFGDFAPVDGFRYPDYPAVNLARLAVDASLQGQGIGAQLVDFAVALAGEFIMPHAGCRFLVVDSKPNAVGFYRRKGFTPMGANDESDTTFTRMFVDLHRLQAA